MTKTSIGKFIQQRPYTVSCEEPISVAEKLMRMHNIRHLPVMDGKRIFGIVSDRDLRLAKAAHGARITARQMLLKDICIFDPYVVDENEPLDAVLTTMFRKRLGSAIITSKKEIAGIFTTTDACRLLAELARKGQV
jgi:acetoin utilization protein AcuB